MDFKDNISYEELLAELSKFKNKCDELTKQNKILERKIRTLQDNQGYEICEFFNNCNSLKETAQYFLYDNILDCGYALIDFNGCSDAICDAKDYKEFRFLAYGNSEDEDETVIEWDDNDSIS